MFTLMNAAGYAKRLEDVQKLARSGVDEITIGTFTVSERPGNSGSNFWVSETGESLNSLGMPNGGITYLEEHFYRMAEIAHAAGKRLRVSVAGADCMRPYENLFRTAIRWGRNVTIEINLGCPNIWHEGKQEAIPSYNLKLARDILRETRLTLGFGVEHEGNWDGRLAVKFSPLEPGLLGEMAKLVSNLEGFKPGRPFVDQVVTANTFPNALAFDNRGRRVTDMPYAGAAGGEGFKHIVLGQVSQWRSLLPASIDVIGAGGVRTGNDMRDYVRAGARGIQVGTAFFEHGDVRIFSDILEEYAENEMFAEA